MRRITLYLIAVVFTLALAMPFLSIPVASESNIISVSNKPQYPISGESITVYLEVNDTSNITGVRLLYCEIEPNYLCYTPALNMTLGVNNTYRTIITEHLEDIERLGYNITVTYTDGSKEYSPSTGSYNYVNITSDGTTTTPPCPTASTIAIQVLMVTIAVVIIYLIIRNLKMQPDKKEAGKKLTSILVVVVIILAVIALAIFMWDQFTAEVEEAPEFTVTDIDGNVLNLSDYRGQVVLLDMMSIPCESCKIVEKDLMDIYPDYEDDVVFISIDILVDDTDVELRKYREDHDIGWTIARDTDEVMQKYSAHAIPRVVIIDKEGFATYENSGLTDESELRDQLDQAISGEAQAISITEVSLFSLAIFAGVASFFSPCAFPMLPGYIAYYLKKDAEAGGEIPMRKAAISGSVSAAGIIIVYLIIGVLMVYAGTTVEKYTSLFTLIIGIILVGLGVLMFTPLQYWKIVRPFQILWARLKRLGREKGEGASQTQSGTTGEPGFYSGLFIYGLGYGAAAAGCTAPVFIAVVLAAMAAGSLPLGILIVILYTVTAALLMLGVTVAIAYFGAGSAQKLSKYTEKIKKISGVVLVAAGIYLIWFFYSAA